MSTHLARSARVRLGISTLPLRKDVLPPVVSRLSCSSSPIKVVKAGDCASAPSSSTRIFAKVRFSLRKLAKNHRIIWMGGFLLAVQKSHSMRLAASTMVRTAEKLRRERMSQNAKSICNNSPGCRSLVEMVLPFNCGSLPRLHTGQSY
jgi:hypothetical protein